MVQQVAIVVDDLHSLTGLDYQIARMKFPPLLGHGVLGYGQSRQGAAAHPRQHSTQNERRKADSEDQSSYRHVRPLASAIGRSGDGRTRHSTADTNRGGARLRSR